jgi:hypothetical protein
VKRFASIKQTQKGWIVCLTNGERFPVNCLSSAKRIAVQCGASGVFSCDMEPDECGELLAVYRDSEWIGGQ